MNILIKSVVFLLLVSGSAYSETIIDAENNLLNETTTYKNHPLYEFMIPEGFKALDIALTSIKKICRVKKNITTKVCVNQQKVTIKRLKKWGYKDIDLKDFQDESFFQLVGKLKKFYIFKSQYLYRLSLKAKRGTERRKKLNSMQEKMEAKKTELRKKIKKQ